jgi:Domain of unknown function (DUF5666)
MQRLSAALIILSLVLSTANATSAETNICNRGIGGTGIQQDGIGGTGKQSEGIGGTGVQANSGVGGTGIIGVITGFASICVNGLEVHYDTQTSVDVDGVSSTIDALNIGQLVAIESSNQANQLKALRVSVSHIMVGKIEKVDATKNTIQMMGQTIHLSRETIASKDLKPNQLVKISGLVTANNLIHALRIDLAPPNTPSSIAGVMDETGKVNGVDVAANNPIKTNRILQVSGHWDGRALQADQISESAMQRVLNSAERVVIQGIAPTTSGPQFNLQNQAINIDEVTKISGKNSGENQTIIVHGYVDRAGKITARSIEYANEKKVLERGGNKHRPNAADKTKGERAERGGVNSEKKEIKDRLEKHEKVERPEKTDRPEKVERPEHTERPERPERHEAHDD